MSTTPTPTSSAHRHHRAPSAGRSATRDVSSPSPRPSRTGRGRRLAVVGLGLTVSLALAGCGSFTVPEAVDDLARGAGLELDSSRTDASDLKVGDCVLMPDGDQVMALKVVDCSEEHSAEMMHRAATDSSIKSYPGEDSDEFLEASDSCLKEPFRSYTGEGWEESLWDVATLVPLEGSWARGERTVECLLVHVDAKTWTGTPRSGEVTLKELYTDEELQQRYEEYEQAQKELEGATS